MSDDETKALSKRVRFLERELRYSEQARARLEDLNDQNQVIRTRSNEELAQKNVELAGALDRLVRAQVQLVQSEKMASLGQLVASVAHELNTPLGVIRASADNVRELVLEAITELPDAFARLDRDAQRDWNELVRAALASRGTPQTSREERQVRRQLQQELEAAGVAGAEAAASVLIELGVTAVSASHLELLRGPSGHETLRLARDVVAACRAIDNIRFAADRSAKMVFALKSFVHPGGAEGESTEGAITEHLDTVLTLYRGQIRHGVELVRDYQDEGRVWGRHDQLNQVWTNLLHNALQAIEGQAGELTVAVRATPDDTVRVDVTDSGPGIPSAVQARVFEPFFTTKRVGEGSGLGLSICSDIVAGHDGTLTFETRPGRTTFSVVLPRRRAEERRS